MSPEAGDVNPTNVTDDEPRFSPEQILLFERHFDEGYDLYDEDYQRWLHAFHPQEISSSSQGKSIEEHFPDLDRLSPIPFANDDFDLLDGVDFLQPTYLSPPVPVVPTSSPPHHHLLCFLNPFRQ